MRSVVSMFWPKPIVTENYRQLLSKTDFACVVRQQRVRGGDAARWSPPRWGRSAPTRWRRLKFLGRGFMASATLITYLVPPSILFIPLYAQMRNLGLANSLAGLIAAVSVVHRALRHLAADGLLRVDPRGARGSGDDRRRHALRRVLPHRPAACRARRPRRRPVCVHPGLERVPLRAGVHYRRDGCARSRSGWPASSPAMSTAGATSCPGAVLTTLPVIAAYIYLQKYMVEGLTAGV